VSAGGGTPRRERACADCARRSWLLATLSGPLECCARDRERLIELLALSDEELLRALAGRRAGELRAGHASFRADAPGCTPAVESTCRHRDGYPPSLRAHTAPHMLEVAGGAGGGADRLAVLSAAPVVAILGSRTASDYGLEMARSLARGLAASGVTVTASMADGIGVAAHAGVLDAGGASVAVMGGGLGVSCPARRRSLLERVQRSGCAVSELPYDCAGRRWGSLASERTVVELASVAVLVEGDDTVGDLFGVRIAMARGRTVAAIPGRVTSARSRGPHRLLMQGASLVRGARDVLELLYATGAADEEARASANPDANAPGAAMSRGTGEGGAGLAPILRRTLER
jgi:DNA processing protein